MRALCWAGADAVEVRRVPDPELRNAQDMIVRVRRSTTCGADLPLLAKHFLNQCAHLCPDGRARLLSDAAAEALLAHAWPGNLRELRHEMQRATVLAGERREIQPEDLSFTGSERSRPVTTPGASTLAQKVEALERREIEDALRRHHGNRTHTAEALGLSRQGLLKKLERFGLT